MGTGLGAEPGAELVRWYETRMQVLRLRASLLLGYERQALVGPGGERLTFDRELVAAPVEAEALAFAGSGPARRLGEAVVFEIKFDGAPTELARRFRSLAQREPGANSKYRGAVQALGIEELWRASA